MIFDDDEDNGKCFFFIIIGFRDDPVNNANVQHQRRDRLGGGARASVSDLEERLRNLERSFREPFHLTNSQC